jgi:hypothetical protein
MGCYRPAAGMRRLRGRFCFQDISAQLERRKSGTDPEAAGDDCNFGESSEQNGTVRRSDAVARRPHGAPCFQRGCPTSPPPRRPDCQIRGDALLVAVPRTFCLCPNGSNRTKPCGIRARVTTGNRLELIGRRTRLAGARQFRMEVLGRAPRIPISAPAGDLGLRIHPTALSPFSGDFSRCPIDFQLASPRS